MTYKFFTLDGDYLETITTTEPESYFGELAMLYGVPVDEIEYEAAL